MTGYDRAFVNLLQKFGHDVRTVQFDPRFPSIQQMITEISPFAPELIIHWKPELNGLPVDYLDSPIPFVHLITDYHVSFQNLALSAPYLHAVLLGGEESLSFFRSQGVAEIEATSLAVDIYVDTIPCAEERPFDVMFVGTIDASAYPERTRMIEKLLALIPEYRVKIIGGPHQESCIELSGMSKIFVNQATLSTVEIQRTIEGIAGGALLMVNEEHRVALDWLIDGEGAVAFNPDNLVQRIRYYLENHEIREQIARQGQKKLLSRINTNHELEKRAADFLIQPRRTHVLNQLERNKCFSSGLFRSPVSSISFDDVRDSLLLNNLGAAYWHCSIGTPPLDASTREACCQLALRCFRKAVENDPKSLPIQWNLGVVYFRLNDEENAIMHLREALKLVKTGCQWPLEAKSVNFYGTRDAYARRFSLAFWQEKLYGVSSYESIMANVLCGIFVCFIEMALLRGENSNALEFIKQWESFGIGDRRWIASMEARVLQSFSARASLEVLSELIGDFPMHYNVDYLKQAAEQFWIFGMERAALSTTQHILRRHLAAGNVAPNSNEYASFISNGKNVEVGLNLLRQLPSLCDVLSH